MDVLAGVRNERHLRSLRGLFARATVLPTGPADYHEAAALYRACRREGETVRKLVDCLIGSIAIRAGAAVLHNDSDFDVLARHTGLRVDTLNRTAYGTGRRRRTDACGSGRPEPVARHAWRQPYSRRRQSAFPTGSQLWTRT